VRTTPDPNSVQDPEYVCDKFPIGIFYSYGIRLLSWLRGREESEKFRPIMTAVAIGKPRKGTPVNLETHAPCLLWPEFTFFVTRIHFLASPEFNFFVPFTALILRGETENDESWKKPKL
jgi:hypothetical protein